jgi:hypothetical protein
MPLLWWLHTVLNINFKQIKKKKNMIKQKLPHEQTVFILGIVSIVGSCCCFGPVAAIFGIVGLSFYNKDKVLYQSNPEKYGESFNKMNTGKLLNIIGIVLGALATLYFIFQILTLGWDGYLEQIREAQKIMGQ